MLRRCEHGFFWCRTRNDTELPPCQLGHHADKAVAKHGPITPALMNKRLRYQPFSPACGVVCHHQQPAGRGYVGDNAGPDLIFYVKGLQETDAKIITVSRQFGIDVPKLLQPQQSQHMIRAKHPPHGVARDHIAYAVAQFCPRLQTVFVIQAFA